MSSRHPTSHALHAAPTSHPRRAAHEEVSRLTRPQPPQPVPHRTLPVDPPGLIAYAVLGARVIRPLT